MQVKDFSKLFGCWMTMDIGHSVLRIIFSGYFIASLLGRDDPMLMQIVQNFLTVMVYFYLVVMVAKRGSELGAKSDEIVNDLDALIRREGLNGGGEFKLSGIRVRTKFMVLDLGIVIPVSKGTCIKMSYILNLACPRTRNSSDIVLTTVYPAKN